MLKQQHNSSSPPGTQEAITRYYSQLAPTYDASRFGNSYGRCLNYKKPV